MSRKVLFLLVGALMLGVLVTSGCAASSCPASGSASCDPQLPSVTTSTGWWIDETGTVDAETLRQLNTESDAIAKDGFQLAGLIVSNAVSDPSKVASDFGNKNGIGSSEKDNGVVVLVLLDKEGNDGHKPYIFMAPGKGLSYLTATKLGQIRDQVFKPARANGHWQQGLMDTVKTIHKIMLDPKAGEYLDKPASVATPDGYLTIDGLTLKWWVWLIIIIVILFLVVVGGSGSGTGGSDGDSDGGTTGTSDTGLGGGGGFNGSGVGG